MIISAGHPLARKYLSYPLACDLVSYGSNIVAQTTVELSEAVKTYLNRNPTAHCFETPSLHVLERLLRLQ